MTSYTLLPDMCAEVERLTREVADLRALVAGREMSLRGLAAIVRGMEVRQGELLEEVQWLRGALLELRGRLTSQGRRPQECYEMSLIDDALKPLDSAAGDVR